MTKFANILRELKSYPSAVAGVSVILIMVIVAIYALATIPYSEAVRLWRGGDNVWLETPRNAAGLDQQVPPREAAGKHHPEDQRRSESEDRGRPGRRGFHL